MRSAGWRRASKPLFCERDWFFHSGARSSPSLPSKPALMVKAEPTNLETELSRFALSIVIPVYNGASSIAELVGALESLSISGGHEIVLVNDGSRYNSLDVCRALVDEAHVPITLVNLARNYGEHNAVMAGLRPTHRAPVCTTRPTSPSPPPPPSLLPLFPPP